MRTRNFRPSFDRLGTRLVLDGSGSAMVSGGVLATTVLGVIDGTITPEPPAIPGLDDWFLPGLPPTPPTSPTACPVSSLLLTTD